MELLFSDENIAVCIKPVGLDSEQELPQVLQTLLGGTIYALHRLDKNVGGVMVYARNKQTAAQLSQCIARGEMIQEYVAMVHGTPPSEGDWEDLLLETAGENASHILVPGPPGLSATEMSPLFPRLVPCFPYAHSAPADLSQECCLPFSA